MRILITGITGTLGTAFMEHFLSQGHQVSGVDHNEERVAAVQHKYPDVKVRLGDFGNEDFTRDKPELVIHLAAFKHIDLCEDSPSACINNNVIKTYHLFNSAKKNGVDILFMSTDKAVEPCSVYGYSKALMEKMALELDGVVVRSGNILASNGSVLDIWEQAIKDKKPLVLTHKDMHRYFISPENLVTRVWEQYLLGERLIIPEMDMDISLLELADRKLREHGLSVKTYPIKYIGLRKGEKLKEKLRRDDE